MNVLKVIVQNLLGFDIVIILLALANLAVYYFTRKTTNELYQKLHREFFLPMYQKDRKEETVKVETGALKAEELIKLRNRSENLYSVFTNLTAIFPLMGILGTVISLLPMVSEIAEMTTNFYEALTSTFWGLVFAIVFKLLDGFLSARIEDNDKNVTLFLEQNLSGDGARES